MMLATTTLAAMMALAGAAAESRRPWMQELRAAPPEVRARSLLAKMTLAEKLVMLHGHTNRTGCPGPTCAGLPYVGNVPGNARLNIPPLTLNDGPQGFRDNLSPGTTTAWPSGMTMAASFDKDIMFEWGSGMGKEFKAKGSNVQLGPGLCLARVPRNGRNFEYAAGEDPYLGYHLIHGAISGIQSENVIANAKHWVNNNQETNRHGVTEIVDDRTRFEMYYPPFAVGPCLPACRPEATHHMVDAWGGGVA
jgi:beta-glucosidase